MDGQCVFFAVLLVVALMQCVSLLAVEPPSKPFLDKNSFYLSSAGFKVHFANDAAGKKAMHALPPHRFVIHNLGGGDVWYLYAGAASLRVHLHWHQGRLPKLSQHSQSAATSSRRCRSRLQDASWRTAGMATPSICPANPRTLPSISAIIIK